MILPNQGFFADKNRAFWVLQCAGWVAYFLLRTLGGLANRLGIGSILPSILVTVTGFSITLIMAWAYRLIIQLRPVWVWTLTVAVLLSGATLFSVLEVWAYATFYDPGRRPEGVEFLGAILLTIAVLGAWTGLYFGINYFLLLDEQQERMTRLSSQAQAAQLEMLRYQINPHFLFNTLNSISTLVLLRETERANHMLSRLSSFLRYSLVGERLGLATLEQEVEALKLYLDIERTRFEDRLQTRFDIDPAALSARLPSLLLQPLVENAVKYAVTPQEEGAEIRVVARLVASRVQITVADTGPGLPAGDAGPTGDGTGVGLGNIRERLSQAFEADHRFELHANVPKGLIVLIDIPYTETP
jgi:signal transduction histidine kinase